MSSSVLVRGARALVFVALSGSLLLACTDTSSFTAPEREAGDRTPLGSACDEVDPAHCVLPWPSNVFTVADSATETGLRLNVSTTELNGRDDPASLNRGDGFSRLSVLATAFSAPVDAASLGGPMGGALRLFLAQEGHPDQGYEVPLRLEVTRTEEGESLLVGDPLEPLLPGADYVAVVTDDLVAEGGVALERTRGASLSLDMEAPLSQEEADLVGHYAPTRAFLQARGIELTSTLRVWEFTTRTAADPTQYLTSVRAQTLAALEAGSGIGVAIDAYEESEDPAILAVLRGRLTGLPYFLDGSNSLVPGADGLPVQQGTFDAPFRVVLPAGEGDYRFVMYGHGTGGDYTDDAFDSDLAGLGVAKVNVRFYGWTDLDVLTTFSGLRNALSGSWAAASFLVQGLAHAAAIHEAMRGGILSEALSAASLEITDMGAVPNPAAGRLPDPTVPMWVGGSLGGSTGMVYAAASPEVEHAVLNVPGAAWSHWVLDSYTSTLLVPLLETVYRDPIQLQLALVMVQGNLDIADGGAWGEQLEASPNVFLLQESMGDPVLPNAGTEMVAVVSGAQQVGAVLQPIWEVESAEEVVNATAITQFDTGYDPTDDDNVYRIHGFAARGGPAGDAAREQILDFVQSVWEGEPRIAVPTLCPEGRCAFSP